MLGRVPCANVKVGGDRPLNCVTPANLSCPKCHLVNVCYHQTFIDIRRKQSDLVTGNDFRTVGVNARPRTGLSTGSIAIPLSERLDGSQLGSERDDNRASCQLPHHHLRPFGLRRIFIDA